MKIIDWARKGNVIRLYLGADNLEDWWGDDWNDAPYEYNAGTVYDEFITETKDIVFPFDWVVLEAKDDWNYYPNSPFCKDDFKARKAPFLVAVHDPNDWSNIYSEHMGNENAVRMYLGDKTIPGEAIVLSQ